jgi:hypothetical protein
MARLLGKGHSWEDMLTAAGVPLFLEHELTRITDHKNPGGDTAGRGIPGRCESTHAPAEHWSKSGNGVTM